MAGTDTTTDPEPGTYEWADRVRAAECDRPHCRAKTWPGSLCTTPNGWMTRFHAGRVRAAFGTPAPASKPHRLTDAQAQRLEWCAVDPDHHMYAPGQYANFRGDAANRGCADAMVKAGLLELVSQSNTGERTLTPTPAGWDLYHTHKLVIRRDLAPLGHPDTCPCTPREDGPR